MADRAEHMQVGAVVGVLNALLTSNARTGQQPIADVLGGALGSRLPDVLEPPTHPQVLAVPRRDIGARGDLGFPAMTKRQLKAAVAAARAGTARGRFPAESKSAAVEYGCCSARSLAAPE